MALCIDSLRPVHRPYDKQVYSYRQCVGSNSLTSFPSTALANPLKWTSAKCVLQQGILSVSSVFCPCSCGRYSSNACSVDVMLVPIGKLLQLVHRLDYHLALSGLFDAVVQCPHIAIAVKMGVQISRRIFTYSARSCAQKILKGVVMLLTHVGKDGFGTLFQVFVNARY